MPRYTHPDDGMVYACPVCDCAGDLYKRTQTGNAYVGDPDAAFSCGDCSATFDDVVERPRKPRSGGGRKSKLELLIEQGAV